MPISESRTSIRSQREPPDPELVKEVAEAVIVPPDGGYGWLIVAASFFCNCVVDGIIFTCGSGFQPEWQRHFGVQSGVAAWAPSILAGSYLLVGPIVSSLANIFGCRTVVLVGTAISATGLIMSMFAPSIAIMYLTFGVIGGIGFGFIFMPSIVIVSYYFEKRRATATGIAVCGSGIGTFLFAPLINYLLEEYNWQSALLLLAGITLNCLVFGALFRPLEPPQKQVLKVEQLIEEELPIIEEERVLHRREIEDSIEELKPKLELVANGAQFERFEQNTGSTRNRSTTQSTDASQRSSKSFVDVSGRHRNYSLFSIPEDTNKTSLVACSKENIERINRPMARMDIFYSGSVKNLPEFRSQPDVKNYVASTLNIAELMTPMNQPAADVSVKDSIMSTMKHMLDVSLLKSPSFMILALSGFFTLCGFFVPFIYLPSHATESAGIDKDKATFLVSILGITNIAARIICGWLSDMPKMNALMINNVALTIGGLATLAVPHLKTYWMLTVYCVLFGFGTACFASLRSVICVELLGLEKLTNAYGLLLLFMGFAALVGSPIAGFLHDVTGDYKLSFYVTGFMVMLSGVMGFPLRMVADWEAKRFGTAKAQTEEEYEVPVEQVLTKLHSGPIPTVSVIEEESENVEEGENQADRGDSSDSSEEEKD